MIIVEDCKCMLFRITHLVMDVYCLELKPNRHRNLEIDGMTLCQTLMDCTLACLATWNRCSDTKGSRHINGTFDAQCREEAGDLGKTSCLVFSRVFFSLRIKPYRTNATTPVVGGCKKRKKGASGHGNLQAYTRSAAANILLLCTVTHDTVRRILTYLFTLLLQAQRSEEIPAESLAADSDEAIVKETGIIATSGRRHCEARRVSREL
jgi:hypothetical protein